MKKSLRKLRSSLPTCEDSHNYIHEFKLIMHEYRYAWPEKHCMDQPRPLKCLKFVSSVSELHRFVGVAGGPEVEVSQSPPCHSRPRLIWFYKDENGMCRLFMDNEYDNVKVPFQLQIIGTMMS